MRRVGLILALSAILTLIPTACGKHTRSSPPMMSHQEAVDEVERLIHEAAGNLSPKPRLEFQTELSLPCAGPNDDQPTGTDEVERRYWLRDFDGNRNEEIMRSLRAYWDAKGYRVVRDDWVTKGELVARHPVNDFTMALLRNDRFELLMTVDSTCVPEETRPRNTSS